MTSTIPAPVTEVMNPCPPQRLLGHRPGPRPPAPHFFRPSRPAPPHCHSSLCRANGLLTAVPASPAPLCAGALQECDAGQSRPGLPWRARHKARPHLGWPCKGLLPLPPTAPAGRPRAFALAAPPCLRPLSPQRAGLSGSLGHAATEVRAAEPRAFSGPPPPRRCSSSDVPACVCPCGGKCATGLGLCHRRWLHSSCPAGRASVTTQREQVNETEHAHAHQPGSPPHRPTAPSLSRPGLQNPPSHGHMTSLGRASAHSSTRSLRLWTACPWRVHPATTQQPPGCSACPLCFFLI